MSLTIRAAVPGIVFLCVCAAWAQDAGDENAPPARPTFAAHEPNHAYPVGRPHPDAPPELQQFAFMLGAAECTDRMRNPDGTWREFPARWNATYFLDGFGIQDRYWTPSSFSTSNLRVFDAATGTWKVTFFGMPRYSSGVWEGKQEGDTMVMRQFSTRPDGTKVESRLTFHDISDAGWKWKSESVTDQGTRATWTSSCRKVVR